MSFKKATVAALLAASMSSAPVMAQTAASASPAIASARAGATTESESEMRGGFIIPAIAIVAIILGIIAATKGSGERPHSP